MSASVQDKPCRRCEASGEFGAQCGDLKVEGDIVRVLGQLPWRPAPGRGGPRRALRDCAESAREAPAVAPGRRTSVLVGDLWSMSQAAAVSASVGSASRWGLGAALGSTYSGRTCLGPQFLAPRVAPRGLVSRITSTARIGPFWPKGCNSKPLGILRLTERCRRLSRARTPLRAPGRLEDFILT